MFKLNVKWSQPEKVDTDYGDNYRREWKLPGSYVSEFFQYWRKNSFSLKDRGYGVTKKDCDWYLTETHPFIYDFVGYEDKRPVVETESFFLAPKDVADKSGLRQWQVDSVGKLCAAIEKWGSAIDGSEMGCHAKGESILMYDGSLKCVEDINVGDSVMGWKGCPQVVTKTCKGKDKMVKIIPNKGQSFIVNLNHILTVKITNCSSSHKSTGGYLRNRIVDINVKDYLKLNKTARGDIKLMYSDTINCWPTTVQPVSPYFFGAILGDSGLTLWPAVTLKSIDCEVLSEIKKECDKLFPIKCEDRVIPTKYKICDKNQRLEILAGLLDTAGQYRNGGFDFCSKSKQLNI